MTIRTSRLIFGLFETYSISVSDFMLVKEIEKYDMKELLDYIGRCHWVYKYPTSME